MRRGLRVIHILGGAALVVSLMLAQSLIPGAADGTPGATTPEDAIEQAREAYAQTQTGDHPMESNPNSDNYRQLTPEEAAVILHKGTEAPFTGKYTDYFGEGVYTCHQCGAMLYRSEDKFKSHCGWPSFDDEILGAVKRTPDADGRRTEITCANCGGHLGHVFLNEGFTEKNTRHCVNSISLDFVPKDQIKVGRAIFAGGCFWGVEYQFQMQPGVIDTTVGYIGGEEEAPTYELVCSHTTKYAEAVEVIYDPARVDFETLAKLFFEIHDPTQRNRQGPDIGAQYRSEIFTVDEEQAAIANKLIEELKGRGMDIATRVTPAEKFWPAEDYHQDWFVKKGSQAACHLRRKLW